MLVGPLLASWTKVVMSGKERSPPPPEENQMRLTRPGILAR
jgi:hypothetical protein